MNNHFYKWFCRSVRQGAALKSLVKTTLMAITMLVSLNTFAQDKTVTGKVTEDGGSGLPGVTVSVKGTNKGTQTDVNGAYKIATPANATLSFSFVGFTKQVNILMIQIAKLLLFLQVLSVKVFKFQPFGIY